MIAEIVVILAFLCSYVPQYYIIDGGYYLEPVKGSGGLQIVDSVPLWLFNLYKVGDIVYSILSWIYLFVFVFLYIAIFRTYYARGHVLFTIISALFPVSAFFLFAIRNNPAVNYEKFMQEQMERMRRAQQGNPTIRTAILLTGRTRTTATRLLRPTIRSTNFLPKTRTRGARRTTTTPTISLTERKRGFSGRALFYAD